MSKRIISMLLALVMVLGMLPALQAEAAGGDLENCYVDSWDELVAALIKTGRVYIELTDDIEASSEIGYMFTIRRDYVLLNLNGKSLKFKCTVNKDTDTLRQCNSYTLFQIPSSCQMTIQDTSAKKTGSIWYSAHINGWRSFVCSSIRELFDVYGKLTVEGGKLISGDVENQWVTALSYSGGLYTGNVEQVVYGTPVRVRDGGEVTINGGSLSGFGGPKTYRFVGGNRMDDYAGAAIALEPGAKVTITGGNFFGLCGAFPVTFEGNVNMTVRGGLYWPAGIDAMLYNVNGKVLGNVVGGAVVLPDDAWKDAADRLDIYQDGVKWTDDQEQNAFIHAFSKIMIEPSQDIPEEGKISATVKEGSSVIYNEEERLDMKLSLTAMTEGSLSYSFDSFYKDAVKGTFYKWKLWRGKNASGEADAVVESTKLDLAAYAGLLSTSPVWTVQCEAVEQVGYYSPKKQTVAYSEPLTIRIPELLKFKDQSPAMQAGSTSCTITRELGTFTYSFDNVAVTTQAANEGLYIAKNYALYAPDGEIISSRTTSDQGPVSDTVELTELGYYMLVENLRYMNQDGDVLETLTNKIYIKTEKQAVPPEVISQPGDIAGVAKDSSVELSAKATGADKAQWYVQRKDGSLIALDTTFDGTTAKATAVASAANVGAKYYCLFTGEKGLSDRTGDITVCYAPVLTDGANVSGYTGNTAFLKLGSADGCGHYGDQTGWYGPDGTKLTDGRYIPMGTTLGIQNLTLSDSGTYTYKYHTAHGELAEAAVTLTVYRGMAPGSTISTFDIYGLDLPVLGENLDTEVNVPTNANYTVQSLTWTGLGSTVCTGTSGVCQIVLKANAGYTFKSGDMAGTVNGIPKTVYSVAENASQITITVDFNNYSSFKVQVPEQDPVELTTERLVFKLNEAASGQKLEATWSCDHGETLKHSGVKFWVSEGTLPAGLTLNADGTVTGTPTEDGVFAVDVTVSTVDAAGNSTNCCGFHTATVAFVVETDHTHTFTKTGTTATCISYGKDTFTCECGASYEAFAEAYGHSFGRWVAHSSSTCTEEGSKIRLCTNEGCDAVEEIKLAALGHSESDWCTSDTRHWTECIRCGLTIKAEEPHVFNENRKCTVCGISNPSNEITSIVAYITPPYAGRYSHSTGDVPADVPYEVDKVEWTDVTDASNPVNLTEGTDVFVKGHTYLAIVYVQALEGYEFSLNESGSTDLTGKLNGEFATVEDVYSKDPASYVCMQYEFGPLKTAISSVNATVEWPTAGNIPNYEATIRGIVDYEIYEDFGATYAKNGIRWYDETTDIYLQPGVDAFVDGHSYTVEIAVKAKDGAVFVTDGYGNPKVTTYIGLNSEPAEAIPNFDSETYIMARYCFRVEPKEGTPVLFTADSEAKSGKSVTVDIEAMAETDDALMDAYFNNDVAYQWYCDGTAISGATGQSLSFTDSDAGKSFYVVVTYGDYESVSETFTVTAGETPNPEDPTPVQDGVYRIAGADRIETSLALADELLAATERSKFDTVIVASALNFPDALTGSYLAFVRGAPILLTYDRAQTQVIDYIEQKLSTGGTVYILGGESAVSGSFETELADRGITAERLAGTDRFGTNLKILEEAGITPSQEILICTATGFADSLSASAAGLPILLVHGSLNADQKAFLAGSSGKFVIIGGEAAVSADLEAELKAMGTVERLGGASRYETSVLVAERFVEAPDAVVLAYARNYPDGLCGGPLATVLNAPLILTDNYAPGTADAYVQNMTAGIVIGGEGLISDNSTRAIFDLAANIEITKK